MAVPYAIGLACVDERGERGDDARDRSDGARQAKKDVWERLMDLYAVGAGLALAIGVERMVRFSGDSDAEIRWAALPVFVALLATLVPF